MKLMKYYLALHLLWIPVTLFAQYTESEPNDSREQANVLSLNDSSIINAEFNPVGDVDYFTLKWQKDCMYYLTSIENGAGVAPNIELYQEGNPDNILTSNVGGRNGNQNFRLSGYVPETTSRYDVKIFNTQGAEGAYKVRFAGGRGQDMLQVHEPDNSLISAFSSVYLAESDTIYGALYPENDIDYYKISGQKGYQFVIGTMPVLDLDVRDTDTYLVLQDMWGINVAENDDIGTINTTSGSVNCTFSKMTGLFPTAGDYYISVRSFYNTDFGQSISETHPPMGEYGLYYLTREPEPPNVVERYPHIEMPTTCSVIVQWNTNKPLATHLLWGESETCENVIFQPDSVQDHLVKLMNLEPESQYFYRVVIGNDSTNCEYFYTARPSTTTDLKFFVIGDSSPYSGFGSTPEQLEVVAQILKKDYDFGLHAGDVNQHHGEEYDLVFYQPYKDILKNAPIFPCVGNHDTIHDNALTYVSSFNLYHNNPDSTERYYSFNYGNGHFISLDTNSPYNPGSPQYEWLVQDLESEMRSETMWTFVYFHKPPWSEGWPNYPGELNVREYLVPLFEQYKVDMTFSGHTHDYERGFLNGVYYIITGGGGAPLEEGIQAYDYDHVTVWINQHHFTYIQTQDNILKLQAINKEGAMIDEMIVEKPVSDINEQYSRDYATTPETTCLYNNYPNPFNSSTKIKFDLKEETDVKLKIYDLKARTIRNLMNGKMKSGIYQIEWDATTDLGEIVSSGIYFVRLETPQFSQMQRIVFIK